MARARGCVFLSCLVAALCSGTAAQAQLAGELSLGDVRFTLTDLDPDDGITPALTWIDSVSYGSSTVHLEVSTPEATRFSSRNTDPRAWADQQLSHEGYLVAIRGQGMTNTFDSPLGDEVRGGSYSRRSFSLTPATGVTFMAKVTLDVDARIPDGAWYSHGDASQTPLMGDMKGELSVLFAGRSELSTLFSLNEAGGALNRSEEELILVTTNNLGRDAMTGSLEAETWFWLSSVKPAVPEAGTWAQMILGMSSLGWLAIARRRRQAAIEAAGATIALKTGEQ